MASHTDLESFVLMEGEVVEEGNVLDLAGLKQAPGLYNDVSQSCRLVFTSEKRLIFTQVLQYAEQGCRCVGGSARRSSRVVDARSASKTRLHPEENGGPRPCVRRRDGPCLGGALRVHFPDRQKTGGNLSRPL